jgi:hypothetical protein
MGKGEENNDFLSAEIIIHPFHYQFIIQAASFALELRRDLTSNLVKPTQQLEKNQRPQNHNFSPSKNKRAKDQIAIFEKVAKS